MLYEVITKYSYDKRLIIFNPSKVNVCKPIKTNVGQYNFISKALVIPTTNKKYGNKYKNGSTPLDSLFVFVSYILNKAFNFHRLSALDVSMSGRENNTFYNSFKYKLAGV